VDRLIFYIIKKLLFGDARPSDFISHRNFGKIKTGRKYSSKRPHFYKQVNQYQYLIFSKFQMNLLIFYSMKKLLFDCTRPFPISTFMAFFGNNQRPNHWA